MRRDLLCAAVAAFLLLSGDAFARQNAQGQPGQNQAQQSQQSQQAAAPSPRAGIRRTGCNGSGTFIAVHCCESSAADNRSPGSSGTQGARTEERSGGRKAAQSFQQRQHSNAGRRLRGRPKSLGGRG